jgi:hypothetical protein
MARTVTMEGWDFWFVVVADSLTEQQRRVVECADRYAPHSGRGGWSAGTMRALQRRGVVTLGRVCTWETHWPLTSLGEATRCVFAVVRRAERAS